jgi:MFS family permease
MSAPNRSASLLLNIAHAIDHLFLLIFATAVVAIAADYGITRWEDLMPYGAGAFLMFGLASLPAGRLGDLWGRRQMMLVFFFGMGAAALLTALAQDPWQIGIALTVLGIFSAIYHPVGIPMLVQGAARPGATIGINGLAGNLGIAAAALITGYLVKAFGWRASFAVPGLLCIVLGFLFARAAPRESEPPAQRKTRAVVQLGPGGVARVLVVMTVTSACGGLIFNLTTNGNGRLLDERLGALVPDPAALGTLLAAVYAIASLAQVVVGRLIDRFALKPLQFAIVIAQVPLLAWAAQAQGWWLYAALTLSMVLIFGAIPFTDATIVRYVDDRMRSRVAGIRLALSAGVSSLAVWALGPLVKASGFAMLLSMMAGISLLTALVVLALPSGAAPAAATEPAPSRRPA